MANLKINRGTTYTIAGTVKINGVLQDLTPATVRFTMKSAEYDENFTDADALLLKNITDGTAEGAYNIILNPSDTAEIVPGNYFYDIKVDLNSDGVDVYKLEEGKVKLDGSPTNRLS